LAVLLETGLRGFLLKVECVTTF